MILLKNLEKQYRKTININLIKLNSIIKEEIKIENKIVNKNLKKSLGIAYNHISQNWLEEKKYLRTFFVMKAIKPYPKEATNLSISLDATINILDDLLDENLETNIKALYILELIRSLSLTHNQKYNKKIKQKIEDYFNKIISIAVLENFYKKILKEETNFNKIVEYSLQIYDCRSLDIDIYSEIPLIINKAKKQKEIVKISRIFRAVNLIKKDLKDIKHDKENKIETTMTIALKKNLLKKLALELSNKYIERAIKIEMKNENKTIKNFFFMIEEEIIQIKKILQKSHFV